ncbi:membrane protein [gut metagenome]|uniref:Membrane protein n=1 Tax=gut metagenome TaxID=749906 RepID=J9GPN6_9ZZZZ
MQTSAAIVTGIDNNTFLEVVFTQDLGIHVTVASIIHGLDVYITESSLGKAVNKMLHSLYPAFVEQVVLFVLADGLCGFVPAFSALRVIAREQRCLPGLSVQHFVVILSSFDILSVDLFNQHASLHLCGKVIERTEIQDLIHLESVALIVEIEEQTQFRCRFGSPWSTVTRSGVGNIQFTQDFTQHFSEVIVVVDMGEEGRIILLQRLQVNSMIVGVVELLFLLLEDMIEHIGSFRCSVQFHVHGALDRCAAARRQGNFVDGAPHYIEAVAIFAEHQTAAYTLFEELYGPRTSIDLPEVHAFFESRCEVERFPIFGKYGTAQVGRHRCQAKDAVTYFLEVHLDCLLFLVLVLLQVIIILIVFGVTFLLAFLVFFSLGLFLFLFLLFLFSFLEESVGLFIHHELVHSFLVHERDVDILHTSPRSM